MNKSTSVFSRLPSKQELERILHSFSKREWIAFLALAAALIVSTVLILGKINAFFMIERPKAGGTITEGVIGTPRFINPVIELSDADKDLTSLVYSGLMRKSADGTVVLDLASGYEISDDGLLYTFTIKEGAVFHDGEPVTADDIVFTVDTVKDPNIKSPKKLAWDGVTAERIDASTVLFTLKQPYASFLAANTTLGILPKHIWQGVTAEQFPFSDYNINAVGTGPYKVDSVEKKASGIIDSISLKSFRRFALGRPYIKELTFKFYDNERELLSALRAKEVRQVSAITPAEALKLDDAGYAVETAILPRIFGLFFNQNEAPLFLDKAIIRAIDLAVDKERIISEVLSGYGTEISSPIPKKESAEAAGNREEALAEAKTILKDAGWKPGEDGILEKTSGKTTTRFSFSISTADTPDLKKAAELVREDLAAIGASVEIKVFETGTLNQSVIRPREYEALLFGQIVSHESDLYAFWHSSRRNDPGLNIAMYTNSRADSLLETALVTLDPAARAEKYAAFEAEVEKDMPAVFLYSPAFIYVIKDGVRNVEVRASVDPTERFLSAHEWFIKTENVWKIFEREGRTAADL